MLFFFVYVPGVDGTSYLFRFDKVYKVGPWGLEPGYPRYIMEVFQGAPRRHISAAVHLPNTRVHYLFKGTQPAQRLCLQY